MLKAKYFANYFVLRGGAAMQCIVWLRRNVGWGGAVNAGLDAAASERESDPERVVHISLGEERSDGTLGTATPLTSTLQGWCSTWAAGTSGGALYVASRQ